jgi:hypothetical protein
MKIVNIFSKHLVCRNVGKKHVIGQDPDRLPEIEASTLRLMVRIVSALIYHLSIGTAVKTIILNAITRRVGILSRTGTQLTGHHGRLSSSSHYAVKC